jgi:hypothetical protein
LRIVLDGRAGHVAIGTEHTAVALKRAKKFTAALAVVIELTGIGRHRFLLSVAAFRAGDGRMLDYVAHLLRVVSVATTDTRLESKCLTIV